ncbi:hypothetical protein F4703DRAFT_1936807 [Phycomyces blakesleeanus]
MPSTTSIENTSAQNMSLESPIVPNRSHTLKRLDISHSKANAHVFKYLSSRCKNLLWIKLNFVTFDGLRLKKTGQLVLEMPFTQLKTLVLYNIKLSYDFVRHFCIKQTDSTDDDQLDPDHYQGAEHLSCFGSTTSNMLKDTTEALPTEKAMRKIMEMWDNIGKVYMTG